MDHRLISTILALLLGLAQAHPLVDLGSEADDSPLISIQKEDPVDVDISTTIIESNTGSRKILLEGDVILSRNRNAMRCLNNKCLWKKSSDGLVDVPYTVSNAFSNEQRMTIENAMKTFETETCIHFVPRSSQKDFISIESRDGCYSNLGRIGGKQVVSLARRGCVYHGVIQHELKHALGFHHEHTRSDRDKYVRIHLENVKPRKSHNFRKHNTNNLNTPYDYTSIMHYGRTAFSTNGKDTITPIPNPKQDIGQRKNMSEGDILRINKLYSCCYA